MGHLKTVVNVTWDDDDGNEVTERYYLLHFGLKYDLITMEEGNVYPVQFTVAICQHCKKGFIECFRPEQLKVIGDQIKE